MAPFGTMELTGGGVVRLQKALGTGQPYTAEELATAVGLQLKTVGPYLTKLLMLPGYSKTGNSYRFRREETTTSYILKLASARLTDYPNDCPERAKIEAQIEDLKKRENQNV